jgi:methylglutamate dehydrogenase subunit B
MRIDCCYCGPRGNEEFGYLGDATLVRPPADPVRPLDDAARARWYDYVYLRDNPAGPHRELWQHVAGCRAWLIVTTLRVASVVISSGPILAALSEAIDRGIALDGLYDGPQMDQVERQWRAAHVGADKVNTWQKVAHRLTFLIKDAKMARQYGTYLTELIAKYRKT